MTNNTLFAASLLSLILSNAPAALAEQATSTEQPTLTIRLYNHAEAPAELLQAAAEVSRRIFSDAGLDTVWVICSSDPERPGHPSCLESPGKSVLRVNVLNREMAAKLGTLPEAFGVAFPDKRDFGLVAAVFHHRIAELQRDWGRDSDLLMGHILAHEIGHLLLGFSSHTQRGIMSALWEETELIQAEQGSFNFHKSQARKMRKQLQARVEHDRGAAADKQLAASNSPEADTGDRF